MRVLHISDLHLGKRLNEFSLLDDQAYILQAILDKVDALAPQAVVIAGDVYDKPLPPAEAVTLLDGFLWALQQRRTEVLLIAGNHDSAERLAFGARLMAGSGVHIAPVYDGHVTPVTLTDAFGPVHFYLLPFVKTAHVKRFYPDADIASTTDALAVAIRAMGMDETQRNVLVAHQFVTGAARTESEEISLGGADNVDAAVFDTIDYVALGHLHGPQSVGRETVRYCGTPLKYSLSEAGQEKSVTLVTLGEKGRVTVEALPLTPRRDVRALRGSYMELMDRRNYENTATDDYVYVTLTDEEDIPDGAARLRTVYPHLVQLTYDNRRSRTDAALAAAQAVEKLTPPELMGRLYQQQNGADMNEAQSAYVKELMAKIWEGER